MEGQKVGQPVPNADVLVTIDDQTRARTTTDGSGHYAFSTLQAGRFTLRISAPGFVTLTPLVDLDRDMRADFALTRQ
jgi:hypothetical protein